jgi:ribokinase
MVIDDLLANGVDATTVRVLPGASTYLSWVAIGPSGDKALTIARTSAMFPAAADVTDVDLRAARHVHLAPFDLPAALAIAVRARACGATVSVDLEPASLIGERNLVEKLIACTDVLLPNSYAVEAWFGSPVTLELARELTRMGPRLVAIGCGAEGSVFAAAGEARSVPALDVPVRDTTGAGDAFNAAVVWGWLRGASMLGLARAATAAAAQVIGAVGARTAQPTPDQVTAMLDEHRDRPPRQTEQTEAPQVVAGWAPRP